MVQFEPAYGEDLAQMTCGSHLVTVKGSFIGQIGKQGKMLSTEKISAKEKNGVPAITALVNHPPAAAGMQVGGGAVQAAGIKMTVTQTNEEAIEIR